MSTENRKTRWKKFAFESNDDTFQSDVQVSPLKEVNGVSPKKNFNFENEITPKSLDDLAVHSKKIIEVEAWLNMHIIAPIKKKSKMLLITGPTGCGKTITVKVLCKKLNIDVKEWVNPIDGKEDKQFSMGQTNQLIEFIEYAKYPTLFRANRPNIILIEDFPNSIIHNPSEFVGVLENCYDNNSQMIFICTDGNSNLNLSHTLFTPEIRDKFLIHNINFNLTAVTLLKKALKRAENLIENHQDIFNVPNQDAIDSIINSCMGDIRCAINQYYFASLQYKTIESIKIRKSTLKRKRNDKNNVTKIESMMKTERLSFFHGLGRVLNPKREVINNSSYIKCDINALVEELGIQPNTFNSFIHANYLKYFGDINDIRNAADILSSSQSYLNKWDYNPHLSKYGLWMTIMGLMLFNEHKISKWNQINAPKKFNKSINNDIETKYLSASDKYYYNIIKKCDNHKFRLSS